jgi:two-component system KDP operon response regulator KdpE
MFEAGMSGAGTQPGGSHSRAVSAVGQPAGNDGKLLVIDHESGRRRSLHRTLFSIGFEIAEASGTEEALALCRIIRCDAVLVAIDRHGNTGIEMCADLRRALPRTAILAMSPDDDEQRKVEALDAGADDYVTPRHLRELIARVKAALRRSRAESEQEHDRIAIGDVEILPSRRLVQKAGKPVHLTPKEFDLLLYLMIHAGLPLTHARLLRAVWGRESANQVEYLRTYMRQLRRKLEDDPASPRYLLTDNHVGYRFAAAAGSSVNANCAGLSPAAPY